MNGLIIIIQWRKKVNIKDVVDAVKSNLRITNIFLKTKQVKMDFIQSVNVAEMPNRRRMRLGKNR